MAGNGPWAIATRAAPDIGGPMSNDDAEYTVKLEMKLYKIPVAENLEYTLDLLLNERLHCAPYQQAKRPVRRRVLVGGG